MLLPGAKRERGDGRKDFGDYKLAPIIQTNVVYHGIAFDHAENTRYQENCSFAIQRDCILNRVFQNAQKSKDLRGQLAKYVVIHN